MFAQIMASWLPLSSKIFMFTEIPSHLYVTGIPLSLTAYDNSDQGQIYICMSDPALDKSDLNNLMTRPGTATVTEIKWLIPFSLLTNFCGLKLTRES